MNKLSNKQKRFLDILWIIVFTIVIYILLFYPNKKEEKVVTKNITHNIPITVVENTDKPEIDIYELKSNELMDKVDKITYLKETDKQEYLHKYMELIDEYSEYCDPPETLQDYFTEDDIKLLYQVVEAEATEGDFINKTNVASVVFNRWYSDKFPEELLDILDKNQFGCIKDGRYKDVIVTQDTIDACNYAFMIEDTTRINVDDNSWLGCIYFEKGSKVHDAYSTYAFTDSIGHKFYY